ncbi:MAG: fibronectin type III domain-containing protein, partial [Desulfobacteraceae bacterium]|nr:fibronectin type III domain-containing protein [Desulfobacteraceae bacterium]
MPIFRRKDFYARVILNNKILIPLLFTLFTIPPLPTLAATVNFAWDASNGLNIAGYKLYYGTSSGNYSHDIDVGNHTSCSISDLQEGKKYYFAATAYNTSDVESDYSIELPYIIPNSSTTGSTPTDASGTSGTITIDNGDPNTSASGKWSPSSAGGFYGANSLYSNQA